MIKAIVRENAYYDSVTLMLISREMKKQEGVEEVLVGMGTDLNLDLVKMLDMFVSELEQVTPNDLFIAAKFDENLVSMDELVASFDEQINSKKEAMSGDYQLGDPSSGGGQPSSDFDSRPIRGAGGGNSAQRRPSCHDVFR
jgi:hypothetical protein